MQIKKRSRVVIDTNIWISFLIGKSFDDLEDNFLLELCLDGRADLLITSDKDLLVLNRFNDTDIITYNKFKNLT